MKGTLRRLRAHHEQPYGNHGGHRGARRVERAVRGHAVHGLSVPAPCRGKKMARGWRKNGWKTAAKKPVKNRDLWERLQVQLDRHSVTLEWVRGHNGHARTNAAMSLPAASPPATTAGRHGVRAGIKRFDAERGIASKGVHPSFVGTAALPFSGRCFQCLLHLFAAPKAPPHNILAD